MVHGRQLRVEHWDVAFNQGKTAALNMLGRDVPHDTVPYFFSDLADWASMEYVGPGSGEPVIRGSLEDGDFTAFYVDDGRVTAALTVGRSDDLEHARRWITEGATPDPAGLADESTDLGAQALLINYSRERWRIADRPGLTAPEAVVLPLHHSPRDRSQSLAPDLGAIVARCRRAGRSWPRWRRWR